jgi:hypothetical protein
MDLLTGPITSTHLISVFFVNGTMQHFGCGSLVDAKVQAAAHNSRPNVERVDISPVVYVG